LDKREAELSELKTQHQDLMHVRKSMIADRDRLSAEVAAEMGRAAQAQQRLHAELDAAHSMRDELQRQAAELREELKEKSEALASANAQVQDKISEVAALAGSLQEQQMLKDRADSESKSALEALAKECAVAAAASKALESDKKELMWKTQAQEDKVADLKTLLAGLQLQLEERRKDLDKCEGEKQEARLEAARLKAERDLQEGKLEETRAKLDAKEEQIKDAMKTVQQVQNMSLERSKEVAKERESQEREREALTRDMLQGKDDLVQAHRELDSLKKSLADLEAKGCSADDALGKSKVEVE
jgi:DNA repair exonuclease SbcCD ATPase subunit